MCKPALMIHSLFQEKCFSYPLTHLVHYKTLKFADVYEVFLSPVKENLEYQDRRPQGVR